MALSADLRERVLAAHVRREGSQRVLAERFGVAPGTVNGWLRQAREGRRAPLARRGGRPSLGGTDPAVLAELVAERPDATLAEYAEMLAERAGRRFSLSVLCRALRRAGLRRKKKRCTRASRSGPTSSRPGPPGGPGSWVRSIPAGSSSSTRVASTPA
jgi:transposase